MAEKPQPKHSQMYMFCSDFAFCVWPLEIFGEVWDGSCFSGYLLRKIQLPIASVTPGSRKHNPWVSTGSEAIGKVLYLLPLRVRRSLMWQCPPPRQSRDNLLLSLNPFPTAQRLGSAGMLMGMWVPLLSTSSTCVQVSVQTLPLELPHSCHSSVPKGPLGLVLSHPRERKEQWDGGRVIHLGNPSLSQVCGSQLDTSFCGTQTFQKTLKW